MKPSCRCVWQYRWVKDTAVPAFYPGISGHCIGKYRLIISATGESDRCFVAGFVVYFQMKAVQSLILSVLFTNALMWIVMAIVVSAVWALPPEYQGAEHWRKSCLQYSAVPDSAVSLPVRG